MLIDYSYMVAVYVDVLCGPNCALYCMTVMKACIIAVWFRLDSGHLVVWFRLDLALCSVGPMCHQVLHAVESVLGDCVTASRSCEQSMSSTCMQSAVSSG